MKQDDEKTLLIIEMKRTIDLLSKPKNATEANPYGAYTPTAELKAKFREIRRDTVRYEKQFLGLWQ